MTGSQGLTVSSSGIQDQIPIKTRIGDWALVQTHPRREVR